MPCVTPGASIATPKGERLVETLHPGDRIITRHNGIQPVRWIGRRELGGRALMLSPHLRPVLVRAGSVGRGRPERDIMVSPNLRMRVPRDMTLLHFDEDEVLAPAKHLAGNVGVHEVQPLHVVYLQIMFDTYEEVLINGSWIECFHPADANNRAGGNAQRTEMLELFPDQGRLPVSTVRPPVRRKEPSFAD